MLLTSRRAVREKRRRATRTARLGGLETAWGTLHLADSSVEASGPESSTVTLTLEVSLKPRAAGRTYAVEVLATDDLGNIQTDAAGTLEVDR